MVPTRWLMAYRQLGSLPTPTCQRPADQSYEESDPLAAVRLNRRESTESRGWLFALSRDGPTDPSSLARTRTRNCNVLGIQQVAGSRPVERKVGPREFKK